MNIFKSCISCGYKTIVDETSDSETSDTDDQNPEGVSLTDRLLPQMNIDHDEIAGALREYKRNTEFQKQTQMNLRSSIQEKSTRPGATSRSLVDNKIPSLSTRALHLRGSTPSLNHADNPVYPSSINDKDEEKLSVIDLYYKSAIQTEKEERFTTETPCLDLMKVSSSEEENSDEGSLNARLSCLTSGMSAPHISDYCRETIYSEGSTYKTLRLSESSAESLNLVSNPFYSTNIKGTTRPERSTYNTLRSSESSAESLDLDLMGNPFYSTNIDDHNQEYSDEGSLNVFKKGKPPTISKSDKDFLIQNAKISLEPKDTTNIVKDITLRSFNLLYKFKRIAESNLGLLSFEELNAVCNERRTSTFSEKDFISLLIMYKNID